MGDSDSNPDLDPVNAQIPWHNTYPSPPLFESFPKLDRDTLHGSSEHVTPVGAETGNLMSL